MRPRVLVTIGLMLGMGSQVGAQGGAQHSASLASQRAITGAPADCDYNACALRVKLSWGNRLIVRGEQEQRVGKVSMFSATSLESIVASSPQAAAEARVFQQNYTPGEIFSGVGIFLMVLSAAVASGNDSVIGPVAGVAVGSSMLFYGVFRHVRAENALNKTIWLYNRCLKR